MRFAAYLAPAFLLVAGAGFFFAKSKPETDLLRLEAALDAPAQPDEDAADAILIRDLAAKRDMSAEDSARLFAAAGRRYMRRKLAYADAEKAVAAGTASASTLETLKTDMERARRVCDLADSLGRRSRQAVLFARAESDFAGRGFYRRYSGLVDRYSGSSELSDDDIQQLEKAFRKQFGKDLPVSAHGSTAAHRAMGFDHTGRVDVAVSPNNSEGLWLRRYLTGRNISFFAFSSAVRGQSTGAHIHIGSASRRLWASR